MIMGIRKMTNLTFDDVEQYLQYLAIHDRRRLMILMDRLKHTLMYDAAWEETQDLIGRVK
jgi:hypothetical protein